MNIEIRDAALQARIRKRLEATGSAAVEESFCICLRLRKNRTVGFLKIGKPSMPGSNGELPSPIGVKEFRKTSWMII